MQRTLRVNLEFNNDQLKTIKSTINEYARIYEEYATWFTSNKNTSKVKAHKALYHSQNSGSLPTALIQSARDNASESVKSYNTRFKKKKWQKNPKYKANSMRYNLRSMNLRGDLLTFSTVNKRQRHLISIPTFFKEKYPDRKLQAGRIGIDKNNQPYALLTFTIPDQTLKTDGKIIGLDRGVRNIVSTSEGVNYSSSKLRANRRKSLYNRSQLQSKGTRSARRKLQEQAGREKRYSAQVNHVISKELANDSSVQTYVLEDLSNLAKKAKSKWMKRSNKRLCDWTHGQLLSFLEYKCEANGISLELVDPKYTSQDCSRCKFRSQSARNGGQYKCSRCGLVIHADENAALNIRDRYLEKLSTS